jgi:hypothetical protein
MTEVHWQIPPFKLAFSFASWEYCKMSPTPGLTKTKENVPPWGHPNSKDWPMQWYKDLTHASVQDDPTAPAQLAAELT